MAARPRAVNPEQTYNSRCVRNAYRYLIEAVSKQSRSFSESEDDAEESYCERCDGDLEERPAESGRATRACRGSGTTGS
ncbi:MAG: hypothetical protein V5A27_11880 [Halapricum sp.]